MFKKILIANRGEIAIRIIRTCREMGIVPVAVFSDCDRLALHVAHAEESYHIGPSPSKDSYLAIDRIINTAKKSGAEAIHPGYGFLAESAEFAEACKTAKIAFIGPSPDSIRRMGDKLDARETVAAMGVPIIPGTRETLSDPVSAAKLARSVGYPIVIKAAAGGGGKGMRVVHGDKEFESALTMTMGEAENAFGDNRVYIEKYIEKPKHIEIQILADAHGNTVSLGERECSMQRRYQKVIEETPSPTVTTELRRGLSEAAKKAAQAVDYRGAGTVEFIVGKKHEFYFLEMNTRLQVEHPITEMVYGQDIVKQQIRIAAGERLGFDESNLTIHGHALEARIYAEDPALNFMPSTGLIKRLVLPQGPGVRNENGIYPGYEIPVYYDPLIGKVVIWAEDRPGVIRRAKRALQEYQVDGVKTNINFLLWALDENGFNDGTYDTGYIDRHFGAESLTRSIEEIDLAAIAASITAYNALKQSTFKVHKEERENVWKRVARSEGLQKPLL
jgi:acetyl-CoA carboxylase biotin carboxylase subunit